jgi:hypothetical protein
MKIFLLFALLSVSANAAELTPKCTLNDHDNYINFEVKTQYKEVIRPPLISRTYEGVQNVTLSGEIYRIEVMIHAARSNKDAFRGSQIFLSKLDSNGKKLWAMDSSSLFGMEEKGINLPLGFGSSYQVSITKFLQLTCTLTM